MLYNFKDNTRNTKTKVVLVTLLVSKKPVGVIKWSKYLNKYAYFPTKGVPMMFPAESLDEISNYLKGMK